MRGTKFALPTAVVAIAATGVVQGPVHGQVPGASPPILDRIILRVVESDDTAATVVTFLDAFHTDPLNDGVELAVMDALESRGLFLLSFDAPPGVDSPAEDLPTRYPSFVSAAEILCTCDAPEGGTGSIYVDGPALAALSFQQQYAATTIGAGAAQSRSAGGSSVVAVLDTGIDATHPGLAGRVLPWGRDFVDAGSAPLDGGDGQDTDGDGVTDEMVGHGTFVAGLITLVAPESRLLPVRVLDGDGVGDAWTVTAGIYYAIDRGVEVINLSLRSTLESEAMEKALDDAWNLGIVVTAAAGNFDRSDPTEYPAMGHPVLGVAAVDEFDRKAAFSNFDHTLFISAPGATFDFAGDPAGLDPDRSIISFVPGGGYAYWEGTSMATPLVAGAAALIRAQHPEWAATGDVVDMVRDVLEASAVDIEALNPDYVGLLGVGRLDVDAAVGLGPIAPSPGDLDGDGSVGVNDLVRLIQDWGLTHSPADLNGDGQVSVTDLVEMFLRLGLRVSDNPVRLVQRVAG